MKPEAKLIPPPNVPKDWVQITMTQKSAQLLRTLLGWHVVDEYSIQEIRDIFTALLGVTKIETSTPFEGKIHNREEG